MDGQRQAAGHSAGTLWFNPPGGEENRRRALTRGRVVAEALAIISALGAYAWADDRDQRFTASLDTLISGLQTAHHPEGSSTSPGPQSRGLSWPPRVLHRGAMSRRRPCCSTESKIAENPKGGEHDAPCAAFPVVPNSYLAERAVVRVPGRS